MQISSILSIRTGCTVSATESYNFPLLFPWVFDKHLITSVHEIASRNLPERFELKQNYPNPFNPSTKIRYSIPNVMDANLRPLQTTLKVFDILGREVETLVNETKTAGNYEVEF